MLLVETSSSTECKYEKCQFHSLLSEQENNKTHILNLGQNISKFILEKLMSYGSFLISEYNDT